MYKLRKRLARMLENRKKLGQDGFTLLELLVVVAILAAIAGTATIALKDTDARASAAAHVAMMDELNKGIRTYRVIKRNELPSRFDSLMVTATPLAEGAGAVGLITAAGFGVDDVITAKLPQGVVDIMVGGGFDALQYINEAGEDTGNDITAGDCTNVNLKSTIASRKNAVVAGNIFMSPAANGCGYTVELADATGEPVKFTDAPSVVLWKGGSERLTGQPDADTTKFYGDDNFVYMLTGVGPSSTLFNANELGGMTTVPVYRHVKTDEYNRFIAVWNIGTYATSTTGAEGIVAGDQIELVAIVDGALDTKEEELGEWDGTRNTI